MFARCPACQTVFRVRPEHLRAHRGEVRCGRCSKSFNALENLLEIALPAASEAAPPPTTSAATDTAGGPSAGSVPAVAHDDGFFVLEEKSAPDLSGELDFEVPDTLLPSRTPSAARIEPTVSDAAPAFILADRSANSGSGIVPTSAADAPAAEGDEAEHDPRFVAWLEGKHDAGHATARADGAALPPPAPPLATPAVRPPVAPDIPSGGDRREPFIASALHFSHDDAPEMPEGAVGAAPDAVAPETTTSHADAETGADAHDFDHDRYGATPAPSTARRWLRGLLIGSLAGTLAAQSIYLFRADIAREWPLLRPALLRACAALKCSIPLPRIAGAITVEASNLLSEPGKPGRFILNTSIRNRAPHPQAYPHLELTLTDAQDRPLARRVLSPQEWSPGADLERGMAAGRDIAVSVPFEAAGLGAAGYRIYAFYP